MQLYMRLLETPSGIALTNEARFEPGSKGVWAPCSPLLQKKIIDGKSVSPLLVKNDLQGMAQHGFVWEVWDPDEVERVDDDK